MWDVDEAVFVHKHIFQLKAFSNIGIWKNSRIFHETPGIQDTAASDGGMGSQFDALVDAAVLVDINRWDQFGGGMQAHVP